MQQRSYIFSINRQTLNLLNQLGESLNVECLRESTISFASHADVRKSFCILVSTKPIDNLTLRGRQHRLFPRLLRKRKDRITFFKQVGYFIHSTSKQWLNFALKL